MMRKFHEAMDSAMKEIFKENNPALSQNASVANNSVQNTNSGSTPNTGSNTVDQLALALNIRLALHIIRIYV
jgi:hypothetical protein